MGHQPKIEAVRSIPAAIPEEVLLRLKEVAVKSVLCARLLLTVCVVVLVIPASSQDIQVNPAAPSNLRKLELPIFPTGARNSRAENVITVKFHTDPQGFVWNSEVKAEIPPTLFMFEGPVKDAVSKWQVVMAPNINNWTVRFDFRLEGTPTNDWAPTLIEFSPPDTWTIITRPACLAGCPPPQ